MPKCSLKHIPLFTIMQEVLQLSIRQFLIPKTGTKRWETGVRAPANLKWKQMPTEIIFIMQTPIGMIYFIKITPSETITTSPFRELPKKLTFLFQDVSMSRVEFLITTAMTTPPIIFAPKGRLRYLTG